MSTSTLVPPLAPKSAPPASFSSNAPPDEVVEIGLLLPRDWATALVELSKKRQQSVGLILRSIIKHALVDSDALV
jgi:hypothetical protein